LDETSDRVEVSRSVRSEAVRLPLPTTGGSDTLDPMAFTIRLVRSSDAEFLRAIYAPHVDGSWTSFEEVVPDAAEMANRLLGEGQFPWLVLERDGGIVGFAHATRYRVRAAYRFGVETSVYVASEALRTGGGRALYTSLFAVLALQGFRNAYAVIARPNPVSETFHATFGFRLVGIHESAGYKLGKWWDVSWWERPIQEHGHPTAPPRSLLDAQADPAYLDALTAGLRTS
jgi:phosphinothricin acetyltransferase